ncbi:hypothetical protein SUGI_1021300 [Cryptomeria japonica]|nr:hypothetical protein SUGI_1021300 [Cryptomeria japonica]
MLVKTGSVPVVVASSSQVAKQFLKTHDMNFASRPSTVAGKYLFYNRKDIVFAPYGAYWRNIRKICILELLNAQRVESFKGVREEEALAMFRSIWEKSEQGRKRVDVSHSVACYTSDLMWRILTGGQMPTASLAVQRLRNWFGRGLKRRTKNVHQRLDAVFDKIIDEHVERKGRRGEEWGEEERQNDLVDLLVDMEITVEEKKAILMDMFLAAIESSASTLEWAMSELLRNLHVMRKLEIARRN